MRCFAPLTESGRESEVRDGNEEGDAGPEGLQAIGYGGLAGTGQEAGQEDAEGKLSRGAGREFAARFGTNAGGWCGWIANLAQREFELKCGSKNIVLKARQMGISTWVAARFFLSTITRPGTLTVQVAHTQEAAEEIFRMVHRFVENLPADLKSGALRRSKSNRRQLVFPGLDSEYRVETAGDANAGRGLTIQNLHCSEVARWGANARGSAGVAAGRRATGRGDCAGVDGERDGRVLLSRVAEGETRRDMCGTFFPGGWTRDTGSGRRRPRSWWERR